MDRKEIIRRELEYFKSDLATEPAFISYESEDIYDDDYGYDGDKCVYKTEDGRKCAVGALIKPALYDPQWDASDGVSVSGLPAVVKEYLGVENIDWLTDLQQTHDNCARHWAGEKGYVGRTHFGKYFIEVATVRGLL